jgi:ribosome-associated protein YbcJ (S4-like RNA binding protein)
MDYLIIRKTMAKQRVSDGKNVIKIVPKQEIINFDDLALKVGYAKAFYSDLKVNLNDSTAIRRNIEVYQKDLFESEDGNSSIVTNEMGNPGLDFWVNYNGNVTTWGNQYLDNLFNLYIDPYHEVINGTLRDPAALSFIEKGANYRDAVVSEANKVAVLRSKAVNIRDYTGALMFDEARTRLYYTVRSLQDYIAEGRIKEDALKGLPIELYELLSIEKGALIEAYKKSNYTIVQQTLEEVFDSKKVLDVLEWIKLGHYSLEQQDINRLIEFYNQNVPDAEKIDDITAALPHDLKMQIVRMTQHLTHIKPEALKAKIIRKQELVA